MESAVIITTEWGVLEVGHQGATLTLPGGEKCEVDGRALLELLRRDSSDHFATAELGLDCKPQ